MTNLLAKTVSLNPLGPKRPGQVKIPMMLSEMRFMVVPLSQSQFPIPVPDLHSVRGHTRVGNRVFIRFSRHSGNRATVALARFSTRPLNDL